MKILFGGKIMNKFNTNMRKEIHKLDKNLVFRSI